MLLVVIPTAVLTAVGTALPFGSGTSDTRVHKNYPLVLAGGSFGDSEGEIHELAGDS